MVYAVNLPVNDENESKASCPLFPVIPENELKRSLWLIDLTELKTNEYEICFHELISPYLLPAKVEKELSTSGLGALFPCKELNESNKS